MHSRLRSAILVVVVAGVVLLGGCTGFMFLFGESSTSPQADLVGTWLITGSSGVSIVDDYYSLTFNADDTFIITDTSDVVIEENTMTEITDTSFVGNIIVQTKDPTLEGTSTFAEYEITTWNETQILRVTFYDDDTKADRFVTLVCEKLP